MKKTQWSPNARTMFLVVLVLVVPAMTVAYRTNSIKIPKTTIYVYIYISTYYTKYNKLQQTKTIRAKKGKATHV